MIFKCIFNRAKTKDQIASELNIALRTVENNIAHIKRIIDQNDEFLFVKNYNQDNRPIFAICKKKKFTPKINKKLFTIVKSTDYPYIIINLPEPPRGYNKWVIIPIGDIHYGSDSCDITSLKEWINWVLETPNVLVVLTGDLIENASKDSPGESVFRQLIPPQFQKEQFIELLAPIAHKIVFGLAGNHGNRSVKSCFLDPERDICTALETEYFSGACYADIICQNYKWELFAMHGGGSSGSTPGGRINKLFKKNQFHSADLFIQGHTHTKDVIEDYEVIRDPTNLSLNIRKRYYLICGTFQKYWDSYAEHWVLPPNRVGVPKISLYCNGSEHPGDYHASI
jgi:predicted phosphodiesterase